MVIKSSFSLLIANYITKSRFTFFKVCSSYYIFLAYVNVNMYQVAHSWPTKIFIRLLRSNHMLDDFVRKYKLIRLYNFLNCLFPIKVIGTLMCNNSKDFYINFNLTKLFFLNISNLNLCVVYCFTIRKVRTIKKYITKFYIIF